jgi:hypothetical protein
MKNSIKSPHVQLPLDRKSLYSLLGRFTALAALLALVGWQPYVMAQSDNFDSGTLSGAWTKEEFFPQSYTFPASGSGKALRIQASPIPSAAPAAAAILQAANYTNFYVAVDVVNWAVEDQAIVLLGRWTAAGLGGDSGMICNYDVAQYGDGPTDRQQGQFQINVINPGFNATTLAAAEITLLPGHSYRMVFQATGEIYKGQMYDLQDLTKPLVTIYADDGAVYTSGLCGFLSFSRNGTAGTTDVTIDNYYAAATDPNTAIAPAIHHPLFTDSGTGVPQVTSRTPAKRFNNFHPTATGISFTAKTYTAGQINASATKLYLNGADVSASLAPLPANGSTVSFTTAAGTLVDNQTYAAEIVVQDTTGTLKSTNTFWFDTFSDAYLKSAGVKTIEAEDYNYNNGQYQLEPIPVSGVATDGVTVVNGGGVGYYNLTGTPGVDFFKPGGKHNLLFQEYRTADLVQITQGSYLPDPHNDEAGDIQDNITNVPPMRIQDTQRSQYVATNVWEYQVRLTSPGDWLNYTRVFAPSNYTVYLRCSSFGATTVYLDKVTSDPTVAGQTTVNLGAFNIGNHIQRLNYTYEPLMAGSFPAVLSLSGTNTLRLTLGGALGQDERKVVMDYLLFVPTSEGPTYFDNFDDGNDTVPAPAWIHYDPIGTAGFGLPTASFTFPGGNSYRIMDPAPPIPDLGAARAGSLRPETYTDFYASVDLLDWDDTTRQAFGIIGRANNIGLGTTSGYLFSWELGGAPLPNTTDGGTDISYLVGEAPNGVDYPPLQSRSIHLFKGRKYRMTWLVKGFDFTGKIYDLAANPSVPIFTTLGSDNINTRYGAGQVGLVAASQGSITASGDATFDNFLVTGAEPRIDFSRSGGTISLSWPLIPFRLQCASIIGGPWTDVAGIGMFTDHYGYSTTASGTSYFRLVYP